MRVIAIGTLREFWDKYPDPSEPLSAWYAVASRVRRELPSDVKAAYQNASFIAANRVVSNIKRNDYRLIVAMHYNRQIAYISFVGKHRQYDQMKAATIQGHYRYSTYLYQSRLPRGNAAHNAVWDAKPKSHEADELEVLNLMVEEYKKKHITMPKVEPVSLLLHLMEARQLSRKDPEPYIGTHARVAEVLKRVRPLSL